jgi:prepilin-type N-terminal cleavage/methylation domain-containing protein
MLLTLWYGKQIKSQRGFSAIELLMVLVVVAAITTISIDFGGSILNKAPGEVVANQAYNYSDAVVRYITTHQNLLRQLLSDQGAGNGKIATVSTQVLFGEGFIKNNLYYKNKLNQSPCTVIWYDSHQLQSFIYYRDNRDSKQLDPNQWAYGLNHMGAMMGFYSNGVVASAAKDWAMGADFVNQHFITQSMVDLSVSSEGQFSPADYYCTGAQIANPSFVVNVTSMLALNNALPKDDNIHQYPDALHDAGDTLSNNRMNTDLIMDYMPGSTERKQSNVIFQMNPDCQMDPNNLPTMQDYDPSVNGNYPANWNKPNSLGCRNLQLAIQAMNDPVNPHGNQKVMAVTGFQQGGDKDVWTQYGRLPDTRPYVGEIVAASFQPTTQVVVGTTCDPKEIGTMTRQQRSNDSTDVNNIYISQLICMKSPLCEPNTNGFCYMPVQNVTLQDHPNLPTYTCPVGTFIDDSNLTINHIDITGQATCHAHDCLDQPYDCKAYNPRRGDLIHSNQLNTAFQTQVPLYRTLTIPSTSWEQWCGGACHFGCGEGPGQIADTQDTITSIQCTNDPSKASMIIQVN